MFFLVSALLFVSTRASAQEPYAVLSDNNTVLTFYYDGQKSERKGMDVGPFEYSSETYTPNTSWYAQRENITSVIFDNSFATCTSITSTAYWFFNCKNLTTITGISNLKTDNVTNMSSMFFNCSKLTSLDVSRFKTGNVTNMSGMFNSCSSLTSLDLSSFITDNVTNMGVMFQSCSSLTSLDVSSFKTDNVTNMGNMFFGCSSLTKLDVSGFRTDNVTVMRNMFYKCSSLTSLDVSSFKTDNVTNMNGMFAECSGLTNLDVSNFKTDNVTDISNMFRSCSSLTSLDVSGFNTDNVTDMRGMFIRCSSLKSLDVSGFKTNNVTTMNGMFAECSNLTSLNLSGIKTDNVTDMSVMFTNCTALKSLDLSSFKTDNVTDMNSMFTGCSSLTTLDLSGFKTDKVTNMSSMFQGCSGLTGLDLSGFKTDNITDMHDMFSSCSSLTSIDLSGFKTDNVTDMHDMFYVCSSLTTIYVSDYWSTAKVTNGELMFLNCSSLVGGRGTKYDKNHLNAEYARIDKSGSPGYLTGADAGQKLESYALLSKDGLTMTLYYDNQKESRGGIDISNGSESPYQNVTTVLIDASFADYRPTNTAFWFHDCTKLQSITGIEYLHTDDVENMAGMFSRCSSLTSLDVSGFKTKNVTDMRAMFYGCSALTSLDVSGFKTENVTDMRAMFYGCSALTSLDVSGFKNDNATTMLSMFSGCSSLTSLDLNGFKTDNVTCMEGMFSGCSSLTSLDLSSFKTDNVTTMWAMFSDCSSLASLDLSSFKTDNVTTMLSMFANCSSLTSLDLSSFKTDNVTSMRAMFQGCSSLSSLNVNSFKTDNMSDMERMFYNCKNLATLDIRNFDTSNAKDMWLMLGGLGTNDNSNNTNIILGEKFNTINNNAGLIFENSTISAITFTGNLPNLSDDTFSGVGTISNPVELVVPSQYAANYSSKMDATGKFYGGYFKMEGISVDTSMPEPNVGTKRLTAITRKQGNNELERSDMTYDDKGRIVHFVYTKGTRTETVSYTYANDIIYIEHRTPSGTNKHEYHFANGKVSYAPITLGSENMTGNRTFEYDSSDQMTKMSIAFDGSTSQQQAKVGWDNGSPVSFSYWRINTTNSTETELHNSSFTLGNMQTEPVVHAIFSMGEGKNVNIDDDIMELMAFYPFVGKLPERLIEKTIYTNSSGSQTEYNFTYETNSQGNIVKVTVASQNSPTVYTLEWDGNSTPDTPTTELPASDNGNEDFGDSSSVNGSTNLNGNVVGNVYYNIGSSNGGYNDVDGCLEITRPTADDDIDGKDIFGEDFRNNYTGIVFRVQAGSGVVKVKAETTGTMMLKVKVGNNAPAEMLLSGQVTASFPYSVTEPTYIYIYGGALAAAPESNRSSSANVLKIYSLEWSSGSSGVDIITDSRSSVDGYYTLDGRKLQGQPTKKGVYIVNGKKIVVK